MSLRIFTGHNNCMVTRKCLFVCPRDAIARAEPSWLNILSAGPNSDAKIIATTSPGKVCKEAAYRGPPVCGLLSGPSRSDRVSCACASIARRAQPHTRRLRNYNAYEQSGRMPPEVPQSLGAAACAAQLTRADSRFKILFQTVPLSPPVPPLPLQFANGLLTTLSSNRS